MFTLTSSLIVLRGLKWLKCGMADLESTGSELCHKLHALALRRNSWTGEKGPGK
jgi:hypothetical protein